MIYCLNKSVISHFRIWFIAFFGVFLGGQACAALPWLNASEGGAQFSSERVQARLVIHAPQGIVAGADVWLGLKIEHQPNWHTYWKNPGDTGIPTTLQWDLPQGLVAQDIQWPTPKPLTVDALVNYGYEGHILLPVPVTVLPNFEQSQATIKLHARWLACRVECIPEEADFVLEVPTQQATVSEIGLFESAWATTPQVLQDVVAHAQVDATEGFEDGVITWSVKGLPAYMQGQMLQLMPEQPDVMVNTGYLDSAWKDDTWIAYYELSINRTTAPQQLSAVIALADRAPVQAGVRVEALVQGHWPSVQEFHMPPALLQSIDAARASSPANINSSNTSKTSFLGVLGLALLGGMLLNLMPCVFPVLSIKALSFAQSGQHSRKNNIISGLAYGSGVIVTMLVLAGLLLILRASGASLGWGFQLQSPLFISLLAGLFLLIGLNLFGVFEVKVFLPSGLSSLKGKTPAIDSFFSGIVSVLIATPCTAPVMGMALGVALVMPAWQTLIIFAALGVGLALPIVAIACMPMLMKCLPHPGAWMETFRHVMAFPMLVTVLWLVWVLGMQTSLDAVISILAIFLALSFFVWGLGWLQRAPAGRYLWKGAVICISAVILIGAVVWLGPDIYSQQKDHVATTRTTQWQPWSRERVEQLQAQGKPVFINFTAAWCLTCQTNKKMTLTRPAVLQAFADKGVVLLEADWTRHDPEIAVELQRFERSGLPVYVLLWPDKKPQLLPEILTPNMVYEALNEVRP